jgi:hypothetical protein
MKGSVKKKKKKTKSDELFGFLLSGAHNTEVTQQVPWPFYYSSSHQEHSHRRLGTVITGGRLEAILY